MSWHYRIRKRIIEWEAVFDIVEMYGGPNKMWTENGMRPFGNTRKELIRDLERMLADAKKYPVLYDRDIRKKVKNELG